jgi:hypothetical protein
MDNKIVIFIIFIVYGQQKLWFDGFCGLWTTDYEKTIAENA